MDLARLLSATNLRIIDAIAREELSIRGIAERVDCSPAKAHQAVTLFRSYGLVSTKRRKNLLVVRPNRQHPLYQKLKALINIGSLLQSRGYRELTKHAVVGVYGSFAAGTDDDFSDVDLLVITTKSRLHLMEHTHLLSEELRREVHPVVLTPEGLRKLEAKDYEFFTRLNITVIGLNGDPCAAGRMLPEEASGEDSAPAGPRNQRPPPGRVLPHRGDGAP